MSRTEDESIAIQPTRLLGVEAQCVTEQYRSDFCTAQWQSKMT